MELWDILNKDGNRTGKVAPRGSKMGEGEYHLVVFVWIENVDGNFIISRRSPNKTNANKWETVGGSVIAGEESLEAALREVKEELGIELKTRNGGLLRRIRFDTKNPWIADIYHFRQEIDINEVIPQQGEVSEAKLMTKEDILEIIESGNFFYGDMYLEYVGDYLFK
ncbi:NUDIX hydrolase [Clostridium sp. Marseille-QA1073]